MPRYGCGQPGLLALDESKRESNRWRSRAIADHGSSHHDSQPRINDFAEHYIAWRHCDGRFLLLATQGTQLLAS